jgi:hypothetical protein
MAQNPELPLVRRFEAAGFRAWPAASVHYDGTWVIRLTAGHPAKRLNSVNPLDPGDLTGLNERVGRAARRFEAYGRPLTFRMSPLSGERLQSHFDDQGWSVFGESIVMRLPLGNAPDVDKAIDQIPLKDISRFIRAATKARRLDPALRPGLSEVIGAIKAEAGLFVLEDGGEPVSSLICVHDAELAGLFEVATAEDRRGQGFGRRSNGQNCAARARPGCRSTPTTRRRSGSIVRSVFRMCTAITIASHRVRKQ